MNLDFVEDSQPFIKQFSPDFSTPIFKRLAIVGKFICSITIFSNFQFTEIIIFFCSYFALWELLKLIYDIPFVGFLILLHRSLWPGATWKLPRMPLNKNSLLLIFSISSYTKSLNLVLFFILLFYFFRNSISFLASYNICSRLIARVISQFFCMNPKPYLTRGSSS